MGDVVTETLASSFTATTRRSHRTTGAKRANFTLQVSSISYLELLSHLTPLFLGGFCKRSDKCWFRHINVIDEESGAVNEDEDGAAICSICQEKPVCYGLLGGYRISTSTPMTNVSAYLTPKQRSVAMSFVWRSESQESNLLFRHALMHSLSVYVAGGTRQVNRKTL